MSLSVVILMFLPATASIKRLLTALAPRPIVILTPSPHLTGALHLINTDNHAHTGIHSHSRTDLIVTHSRAFATYTLTHTHTQLSHIHALTGVDAFAVTDLLKAQAGQIHASLFS